MLRKHGACVRVVMTASATGFITPLTLQALSGNPVHTDLFDVEAEHAMGHIDLAKWADLLVIAPATANMLAKCCHGLADDFLSTLYLAVNCPVYMAPAMNQAMWHKTVTQENVLKLKSHGVQFIGPDSGGQACGDMGLGRMAEPEAICNALFPASINLDFQGIKILISAGPTREPLDPVRYITNRSSGKMGYALANAAAKAGAEVTLVSGPVSLYPPDGVKTIHVETAGQMYDAVLSEALNNAIYIGAAAVADYSPALVGHKIKKHDGQTSLLLHKTKDILASVAALDPKPFTVGFAAETDELERYALTKLQQKKADMIAANWVGRDQGGFDSDQNALQVFWQTGQQTLAMTDKNQLAEQLLELILKRFRTVMP